MAKTKTTARKVAQEKILEGLRKALDGGPHRLQGSGKPPGLFPGGVAGLRLATQALDEGFLRKVPGPPPKKGSRARPATYVSLTEKGQQFVRDGGDFLSFATALQQSLEAQSESVAEKFQAISEQFDERLQAVQAQFANYQKTAQALQAALGQRTPPPPETAAPPDTAAPDDDWLDEVVRAAAEQKRLNAFERLTLPRIYEQLKKSRPGLTLGQFHDGLRKLYAQRRIRLTAYTQALATLPDAQNALYLDREVKYYVDLP